MCVYGVRECSIFVDLYVTVQLSQQLLKRLSFLHCIFLPPLLKINSPWVCGFISRLSILFHWFICLFLCQDSAGLITMVFYYHLKSGTNTQKRCPFHYRGLECKSRKSRNTWSNRQIWPWGTEWSRAKTQSFVKKIHRS